MDLFLVMTHSCTSSHDSMSLSLICAVWGLTRLESCVPYPHSSLVDPTYYGVLLNSQRSRTGFVLGRWVQMEYGEWKCAPNPTPSHKPTPQPTHQPIQPHIQPKTCTQTNPAIRRLNILYVPVSFREFHSITRQYRCAGQNLQFVWRRGANRITSTSLRHSDG